MHKSCTQTEQEQQRNLLPIHGSQEIAEIMVPKSSNDAYNAGWIGAWRENDISAIQEKRSPT